MSPVFYLKLDSRRQFHVLDRVMRGDAYIARYVAAVLL
ncbi:hypothetical protein AGRO_4390 [Agrobacterium sp. ATCC 31749]|nr:hypothetical protein AGRO_4390 [Agrobacterium sp. ATCC 31749]